MNEISYATAGDVHIAYRTSGTPRGIDAVIVAGARFPFELLSEDRAASRFVEGIGSLGRLVVFDRRGVGLSDPLTDFSRSAQEQWAEDLLAVIDAAGLDHPVVVSWEALGTARRAAARRPDLIGGPVLINPAATTGPTRALITDAGRRTLPTRSVEARSFPSRSDDPGFLSWLARAGRSGASPTVAERIWEHMLRGDEPLTPAGLTVPTPVLHNRHSLVSHADVAAVVDAIPGAELVEVDGPDIYPIAGDVDALVVETVRFVTGVAPELIPERCLAAVLFTDLVDSTRRASTEGDRRWRDLLDLHDGAVRRCVARHGGRVVKSTGDGVLALLPSASAALDAERAIFDEVHEQGLEMRAGVHVGDVDVRGDDISGIVVNVAARIMSEAPAGTVLVSESLRQATLGSGFRHEQHVVTALKGVPRHADPAPMDPVSTPNLRGGSAWSGQRRRWPSNPPAARCARHGAAHARATRRAAKVDDMDGQPTDAMCVRTAELIGALCLATDLSMGFPFEHGLHETLIAMRIAERLDVDDDIAAQTYYASLLSHAGCTATGHVAADVFGGSLTETFNPLMYGSVRDVVIGLLRTLPSEGASGLAARCGDGAAVAAHDEGDAASAHGVV